MSSGRIAIMIDGSFFLKRLTSLVSPNRCDSPDTLTLKRHVDTIVLVAGDSDFVPAAKLARREGIEFILDPLWQKVNADLFEHIDGLQSGLRRPGTSAPAGDPQGEKLEVPTNGTSK